VNLYLDDIRGVPNDKGIWIQRSSLFDWSLQESVVWRVVRTVKDCIHYLQTDDVPVLSLDHDLGETDPRHCGYDVLLWLEEQVIAHGNLDVLPQSIIVHSANISAKPKMELAVKAIYRHGGQT